MTLVAADTGSGGVALGDNPPSERQSRGCFSGALVYGRLMIFFVSVVFCLVLVAPYLLLLVFVWPNGVVLCLDVFGFSSCLLVAVLGCSRFYLLVLVIPVNLGNVLWWFHRWFDAQQYGKCPAEFPCLWSWPCKLPQNPWVKTARIWRCHLQSNGREIPSKVTRPPQPQPSVFSGAKPLRYMQASCKHPEASPHKCRNTS